VDGYRNVGDILLVCECHIAGGHKREMKQGASRFKVVLPKPVRGRIWSGAKKPGCECGPDNALKVVRGTTDCRLSLELRAREGKSSFFQGSWLTANETLYGLSLSPLRRSRYSSGYGGRLHSDSGGQRQTRREERNRRIYGVDNRRQAY